MTTLYRCPDGHISSVARVPNEQGVRRCFFCPKVTEALLDSQYLFPTRTEELPVEVTRVGGYDREGDFNIHLDIWVIRRSGECLNKDGKWEYEPLPSSRTDEFKARTRFPLATALALAADATKKVKT